MKIKKILSLLALALLMTLAFEVQLYAQEGADTGAGVSGMGAMAAGSMVAGASDNKTAKYAGAAINVAAGGIFIKEGLAHLKETPTGYPMAAFKFVLAAASFAQASVNMDSAKKDKKTEKDLDPDTQPPPEPPPPPQVCANPPCVDPPPACANPPCVVIVDPPPACANPPCNDPDPDPTGLEDEINENIENLANDGYTVDTKKGTFEAPGGKSGSLSNLGDKSSISDTFGISEDEAGQVLDNISKMEFKGGGGYSSPTATYADTENNYRSRRLRPKSKKKRKPTSLVGMTKKTTGGDLIGVKEDNIFEIIHRTYRELRKEGLVLPPDYQRKK